MKLALAPTEEDPEGKGAGGDDPVREEGAVIEKGLCSSRSTNSTSNQSEREARRKEEAQEDQNVKSSIPPETFSTMPVMYLAFSEAKKITAWATHRSEDFVLKLRTPHGIIWGPI
jgi:hypothetical protein